MRGKYNFARLFFLGLLMVSLFIGCRQEESELPALDAFSDIQLLPKPAQPINPGSESFITVLSTGVTTDFPQSLTFSLEAESTHHITDVQLLYTTPKILRPSVIVTVRPDFEPDTSVQAEWTWNTRKSSLPAGAKIQYNWIVENAVSETIETETMIFAFDDIRYDWKELEDDDIHLYWYEGDESFGRELMRAARQALVKLATDTDSNLEDQVRIYIYGNTKDLHESLVFPDQWTGGQAYPEYSTVVIGIDTDNLEWGKRAVTHEISHMVIYQETYSPLSNVPTWLDEGLAVYSEGELESHFKQNLEKAILNENLFSIQSISGSFPSASDEAELAYAQSYSLVEFLIENFGSAKIQQLLQAFSDGINLDNALTEIYGFDSEKLEIDWRKSVL